MQPTTCSLNGFSQAESELKEPQIGIKRLLVSCKQDKGDLVGGTDGALCRIISRKRSHAKYENSRCASQTGTTAFCSSEPRKVKLVLGKPALKMQAVLLKRLALLLQKISKEQRRTFFLGQLKEEQRSILEVFIVRSEAELHLRHAKTDVVQSFQTVAKQCNKQNPLRKTRVKRRTETFQQHYPKVHKQQHAKQYSVADKVSQCPLSQYDSKNCVASSCIGSSQRPMYSCRSAENVRSFQNQHFPEALFTQFPALTSSTSNVLDLCEGQGRKFQLQQEPRGKSKIHGIVRTVQDGFVYYHAQVGFAYLVLRGKKRQTLSLAVNDHKILSDVKQRVLLGSQNCDRLPLTEDNDFEETVRDVFEEHGVSQVEMGLRIFATLSASCTQLIVGRALASPSYSWEEIKKAMATWRSFRKADGFTSRRADHQRRSHRRSRTHPNDPEILTSWSRAREAYLDAWCTHAEQRERVSEKLERLAAPQRARHWAEWERFESAAMAREEKTQRARQAAFDRNAAVLYRQKRRFEDREIKEMQAKDRDVRRAERPKKSASWREIKALTQLKRLAIRWTKLLEAAKARASYKLR